ncbi:MAG: 50S ribosomal protein L29 [Acidobacteriota bacterium]|nr:50S ribosomal protein L29 [Acidobacteriota bacterium]
MKARELRELGVEELRNRESDLAEQLFALRLQQVTGQIESPAKLRDTRRDLARVLTVLRESAGAE